MTYEERKIFVCEKIQPTDLKKRKETTVGGDKTKRG